VPKRLRRHLQRQKRLRQRRRLPRPLQPGASPAGSPLPPSPAPPSFLPPRRPSRPLRRLARPQSFPDEAYNPRLDQPLELLVASALAEWSRRAPTVPSPEIPPEFLGALARI